MGAKVLALSLVLVVIYQTGQVEALVEGLYCGVENCYDVLGVTRASTRSEIAKAYRALARKHHPDMHQGDEAKAEAEIKFKTIAAAYEVLKDDASREDYDYMVDHPEEFYAHYYRYFKRRTAPNVDVRLVLAVCVTLVSAVQCYTAWTRYDEAVKYLTTVPKYRLRAVEIAKEDGTWPDHSNRKGRVKDKAKEREEQEAVVRKVIEEKMDIRGGYAKPDWREVLWVQLVLLPWTSYKYVAWYVDWIYRFRIKKEEFGDAEKLYLIRKNLSMSRLEFEALDTDAVDDMLDAGLWNRAAALQWKAEKEEEEKRKLADNARHKAYRRYMKNHGPGRITFED